MKFSREQLAYLRDLLTPTCCHTTGMHNPNHFEDDKYVCADQKAKALDRARVSLHLKKITPQDVKRDPECGWCHIHTKQRTHDKRGRRKP